MLRIGIRDSLQQPVRRTTRRGRSHGRGRRWILAMVAFVHTALALNLCMPRVMRLGPSGSTAGVLLTERRLQELRVRRAVDRKRRRTWHSLVSTQRTQRDTQRST